MLPFVLLLVFLGLAFAAIVGFAVLAWPDQQNRRDDLKKFLASFAGTALALSVGFMSLLLQQHNHNQELRSEETSKIRAGLLHSVIQKKMVLDVLKEFTFTNDGICDVKIDEAEREKQFRNLAIFSMSGDEINEYKDLINLALSSPTLQQASLDDLLKKSSLSSLVDQEMASSMLEGELELILRGPRNFLAIFDPIALHQRDKFCASAVRALNDKSDIQGDGQRLQVGTCIAYSAIRPDNGDSVQTTAAIKEIADRSLDYGNRNPREKLEKFWNEASAAFPAGITDLRRCLKIAGINIRIAGSETNARRNPP